MGKAKQTPMEKLADKARKILKSKSTDNITKQDFNAAVQKAVKPKGRGSK